jgi:transcriptional regulator with XRE-family HTH domain
MRLADFEHAGAAIRQLRANLGITAAAAAKDSDVDSMHWTKVERGPSAHVQLRTIEHMLDALGWEIHFKPKGISSSDAS